MTEEQKKRPAPSSTVQTRLLRAEGLALAIAAIVAYRFLAGSWGFYFSVWLVPDLAMIAYVAGPVWGARAYNTTHNLLLAISLTALGAYVDSALWMQLGLIWVSHVGLDRALGYGLKYPDGFHYTHFVRT
jgi:hypothetical protein